MPEFKIQIPSVPVRDLDQTTDPAYQSVVDIVKTYSITPRTLVSKTLLARDPSDTHPARSVEKYEYRGNEVLRFGINAEFIDVNATGSIVASSQTAPRAPTGSTTAYTAVTAQTTILHNLEKTLITDAVRHLGAGAQTVLVDIFERNNGGPINVDSQGHPIVHTIVLYRGSTSIQVIDPSNFLYSSHLANTNFNGELTAQHLPQIETIHKKIQIYKPDTKVGTGNAFDKYRDCTDVAVKLAFGLNAQPLTTFDDASIKTHPVVVRVSNSERVDEAIVEEKIPSRIKQTSSLVAQEDFAKIQASVDKKLTMFENTDSVLYVALKQQYLAILCHPTSSPIDILRALVQLDFDFNKQLVRQLDVDHQVLETQFAAYEVECTGLIP